MANWCDISIYFPLHEMKETEHKRQLFALYWAQKEWEKHANPKASTREKESFIAAQPGVPFERTKNEGWNTDPLTGEKTPTNDTAPDNEQWYRPSISADFNVIDSVIWVHPYFELYLDHHDFFSPSHFKPIKDFKHGFPWWAQIGFAGAKKTFDGTKSDESPNAYGLLFWELPVKDVVHNLRYVSKVHKRIPVQGTLEQWLWAFDAIDCVKEIMDWFELALTISDKAIAKLDWAEVAMNMMFLEDTQNNNDPNDLMRTVKALSKDIDNFRDERLGQSEFTKKWAVENEKE